MSSRTEVPTLAETPGQAEPTRADNNAPCELYRHYDANGALLYVGISASTMARLRQHKQEAEWFDQVAWIRIQRFASRWKASLAEQEAIHKERPRYNKAFNYNPGEGTRADPGFVADVIKLPAVETHIMREAISRSERLVGANASAILREGEAPLWLVERVLPLSAPALKLLEVYVCHAIQRERRRRTENKCSTVCALRENGLFQDCLFDLGAGGHGLWNGDRNSGEDWRQYLGFRDELEGAHLIGFRANIAADPRLAAEGEDILHFIKALLLHPRYPNYGLRYDEESKTFKEV
jgi:hypothetical protein